MNENRPLFDDAELLNNDDQSQTLPTGLSLGNADHSTKLQRSALWAAYGDALGWISELTDERGLKRRTSGKPLERPMKWTRRIGGPMGVTASLPTGCYSDDSQLRLATSRAIHPDGFNVDAFAKVELPIWLSYALGGGKSTTAAASNLGKPRVQWFANSFKNWTASGGNGAAMRIQPHVWAASTPADPTTFLGDVVRNAVCSHSHPNGLLGATIHALALAKTIVNGRIPSPDDLLASTDVAAEIHRIIEEDFELRTFWLSAYQHRVGSFSDSWLRAIEECRSAINMAAEASSKSGPNVYADVISQLKLRDPSRRGSGLLTAVAAVSLIWCEANPEKALIIAANELGTDTDTIATMAGAIMGIIADEDPPVDVLDADTFRTEAERLSNIAAGRKVRSHLYPDPLHWSAPRTRADSLVCVDDEGLHVLGMGDAKAIGPPLPSRQSAFQWQWVSVDTGQTLLIKRRKELARTNSRSIGHQATQPQQENPKVDTIASRASSMETETQRTKSIAPPESRITTKDSSAIGFTSKSPIDEMLVYLEKNNYADWHLGRAFRRTIEKGTTGEILTFVGLVIDRLRSQAGERSEEDVDNSSLRNS